MAKTRANPRGAPKRGGAKRKEHKLIQLTAPQEDFFSSKAKYSAFVGGIGSGKSWVGAAKVLSMPAGSRGMIIAPSYKLLTDATLSTFLDCQEKIFGSAGVVKDFNKSEMRMWLSNGVEILWRSADQPELLRGPSIDWLWGDEAAYFSEAAWDVGIGRLRGGKGPHQAWITTTPNGRSGSWVYTTFVEDAKSAPEGLYHLTTAPTSSNHHLPTGYLEGLEAKYSSHQQAQELHGEFIDSGNTRIKAEWLRKTTHQPQGRRIGAVDLAISTKDRADFTAMVGIIRGRDSGHVFAAKRHKLPFHQSMEEIAQWCLANRIAELRVEDVAFQKAAVQALQRRMRGTGVVVRPVRPKGNKLARFLPAEAEIEQGVLTFSPALPPEFFDELLSFTGTKLDKHDDWPDALAYAAEGSARAGGMVDAGLLL